MCDPVSAIMFGVQAAGAIAKGVQDSQAARANAAALETQKQARDQKAAFDTEQAGRKFERTQGATRAGIATTGIDVRSFYDVLADNASESALERKAIRYSADVDTANIEYQASAQRAAASNAFPNAVLGVATAAVGAYGRSQTMTYLNAKGSSTGGVVIGPASVSYSQ